MKAEEFLSLPMKDKLKFVNEMLEKETKDHLKNTSQRLGISYNSFTKIMRDNGNYQYNQTSKQYEKLMSLEEYEKYLDSTVNTIAGHTSNETLQFLEEHMDELKRLLENHANHLMLDPMVYDPSSKTATKTFQVNANVYNQFAELCTTQFPHLRQKDIVSMSLLEFCRKYQKSPSE